MQAASKMHLTKGAIGFRPLIFGAASSPLARRKATQVSSIDSLKTDIAIEHHLPFSKIPGPKRVPILGSVPFMVTDPLFDFKRLPRIWGSYFKKYGPIFRLTLPGQGDVVYLARPKDIEHVMRATSANPIRPFLWSMKKVREEQDFFIKGQTGIFTEHGEEWWRVRRLVQTSSMKPKMVAQYLPQMDQVGQEFVDRIADMRDDKMELPGDFTEELFKWSVESVCLVILNRRMGCFEGKPEGLEIIETAQKMFDAITKCEYGFHWWKFVKTPAYRNLKASHDIMLRLALEAVKHAQATLAARGNEEGELNLVESMINTPALSYEDIVTHIVDFFAAAADTTSMTFLFTMYSLAQNPEKQAEMQRELDQVLGKDLTAPITPEKLGRLSYTKACLRESLRMHAIVGFIARQLHKDLVIGGYEVPKGTLIFNSQFESGRDEEAFQYPNEFRPERWLRGSQNQGIRVTNHYASIPFSIGPRMCVGSRIAQQEVYVLMARLFQRFNISYKYKEWDPTFQTVLFPDQPQKFTVVER